MTKATTQEIVKGMNYTYAPIVELFCQVGMQAENLYFYESNKNLDSFNKTLEMKLKKVGQNGVTIKKGVLKVGRSSVRLNSKDFTFIKFWQEGAYKGYKIFDETTVLTIAAKV